MLTLYDVQKLAMMIHENRVNEILRMSKAGEQKIEDGKTAEAAPAGVSASAGRRAWKTV